MKFELYATSRSENWRHTSVVTGEEDDRKEDKEGVNVLHIYCSCSRYDVCILLFIIHVWISKTTANVTYEFITPRVNIVDYYYRRT